MSDFDSSQWAESDFSQEYREHANDYLPDRFKLIEYVVEGKRTTQLFDLVDDPMELKNLADERDYSQKLEELRKKLRDWKDWDDWGEAFWKVFE